MTIQQRILKFVTRSNWILFIAASIIGGIITSPAVAKGIIFGGLIVTINFHALARTLRNALTPPYPSSHTSVLAKYYIRFTISGVVIFFLISQQIVNPIGLFIGLSVVVASILIATISEVTKIIFKEAV